MQLLFAIFVNQKISCSQFTIERREDRRSGSPRSSADMIRTRLSWYWTHVEGSGNPYPSGNSLEADNPVLILIKAPKDGLRLRLKPQNRSKAPPFREISHREG